ncbi:YitT family protein [Mycoplasma todarodis]|uniref:DUF2179 domain-containing protein n=1 Tax=Mycoplasma todarodis TaxID=1937191 RepID=A0A4R0XMP2_9MOLU|nr:YitT family protein [Mycoplasma todarodis]TCG11808.1 hypothetical protein C4B25_00625 [Mycoplasma todarodis]
MENEIKKVNKISVDSYKEKIASAKTSYESGKKRIETKYKKKIANATSTQEVKALRKQRKTELIRCKNKYAFKYNALINQKLFRRAIFESKAEELKNDFKRRKSESVNWDQEIESKKLTFELKRLQKKYSRPVSTHYLTSRNKDRVAEKPKKYIRLATPLKKNIKTTLLLILAAIITTLALDVFIKPWGLYNVGLRGITQTLFYVWQSFTPSLSTSMSYVIFFIANIPFAIFGWFKLGKRFTIITIIFIATQYLFSFIFDYSHLYSFVKPFGHTVEFYKQNKVEWAIYTLPFISVIIGGIIYGVGVGLIYKAGGSTGGSKFVVTWLSAKKNKPIGFISLIIALFVVAIGITVNKVIIDHDEVIVAATSTAAICSMIFAWTSNMTLDKVFPKSKKTEIKLFTTKKDAVIRYLDINLLFNRPYSYHKVSSAYKTDRRYEFNFIVSSEEKKILVDSIRNIDPQAFISISDIKDVSGRFYNYWFE